MFITDARIIKCDVNSFNFEKNEFSDLLDIIRYSIKQIISQNPYKIKRKWRKLKLFLSNLILSTIMSIVSTK